MVPSIKNGTHVQLNDGSLMPLLGLGVWQSPQEETSEAVECALKNGYTHIDTAYNYMNEEAVGEGIRRWGGDRKKIFVVTKLSGIGMTGGAVERFLKLSLTKLGLDYVDLYLIHTPIGFKYVDDTTLYPTDKDGKLMLDYTTDHIALWKEMEAVKASGLTKSIGVSNFSSAQLRRLMQAAKVPPAVNQVEMHIKFQQQELREYCSSADIVLTAYAPFASPGRAGTRFGAGITIPNLLEHPVVSLVASTAGVSTAQVLVRFWIQQGVAVVPKSVTPARIIANGKVFDWSLSDLEMAALRFLDKGEAGRTFSFLIRNGMELHPESPIVASK